jgi:hypothetical protein
MIEIPYPMFKSSAVVSRVPIMLVVSESAQ